MRLDVHGGAGAERRKLKSIMARQKGKERSPWSGMLVAKRVSAQVWVVSFSLCRREQLNQLIHTLRAKAEVRVEMA